MKRFGSAVALLLFAFAAYGQETEDLVHNAWGVFPMIHVIIRTLAPDDHGLLHEFRDKPMYIVAFNIDGTARKYHPMASGEWQVNAILWSEVENQYSLELSVVTQSYDEQFRTETWQLSWFNDGDLLVTTKYQYPNGGIVLDVVLLRPWAIPEVENDD